MRYLIIFCLFIIGCTESTNNQSRTIKTQKEQRASSVIEGESDDKIKIQESDRIKQLLENPLDIFELKEKYHATSTFMQSQEAKRYFKPSQDGFLGIYIFGADELVVFNNEKPWKYNNKTDIFIEVRANTDFVVAFDSVTVGIGVSDLKKQLGYPQVTKGDLFYYHNGKHTIATFKISGDTIEKFRVGKYNVSVEHDGIPEFLKDI